MQDTAIHNGRLWTTPPSSPRAAAADAVVTDTGHPQSPSGSLDATVGPSATLPALDTRQLRALQRVGEAWSGCVPDRETWERALPVDPQLRYEEVGAPGRFVGIATVRPGHPEDLEDLEATPGASQANTTVGRPLYALRRAFIGPALRSAALAEERMGKLLALAVLSPDAISSVAYGPEAMLAVLALAGSQELRLSLPIGGAIAVLMIAVGLGYRQVIRAYPHGGGSYIVAKDNLGPLWGLFAGAGLILDYILTVAVSVASGVAAVTSAVPSLQSAVVPLGLVVIALLVVGNIRGTREAGALFSAPTYLFVVAVGLIVIVGLVQSAGHGFTPVKPHLSPATEGLSVLLVLRAFASGATAMTGIEVISNAVPVFHEPQAVNARRTLTWMLLLLVSMFVGVVLLGYLNGVTPGGNETVLSKLAHETVGSGALYIFVQAATALILLVAANSAFNGLPRLLFFMARDEYVPRAFLRMGDRLAFTNGIALLAIAAAIIYVAFGGLTEPLIPLFAVGVFLAFTLAQGGMVVHWWRNRDAGWRGALVTNALGSGLSGLVVLIAALTKFTEGAWVVVILIPAIVLLCRRIHLHYERAREALMPHPDPQGRWLTRSFTPARVRGPAAPREAEEQDNPGEVRHFCVVPIAVLDLASLRALAYAVSLSVPVLALHISPSEDEATRFHTYWQAWGDHVPLEVVVSPYRATLEPLANYIEALHRQRPDVTLTLVVPEVVVRHRWERVLQNRTSTRLRGALRDYEGIAITTVPFHLPE